MIHDGALFKRESLNKKQRREFNEVGRLFKTKQNRSLVKVYSIILAENYLTDRKHSKSITEYKLIPYAALEKVRECKPM